MPKIKIKEVKRLSDSCFGTYKWGKSEYIISISEKKIKKDPSIYLETLIHELLHFIFTRLRVLFRAKLTNHREHILIGKIEESIKRIIINEYLKILKNKEEK